MPRLHPEGTPLQGACAVCVEKMRGGGLHSGLLYRRSKTEVRYLHMYWHEQLKDEEPPERVRWVQPTLSRKQKLAVQNLAFTVAEVLPECRVPYAFSIDGVSIDVDTGEIDIGAAAGLSCSSFVHVLFVYAKAPLVLVDTYDEQRSDKKKDQDAQLALVNQLRSEGHKSQADRAAAELPCPRIRPEEIAGASGLRYRPAEFKDVEPAGLDVLAQIH